MNEAQIVADLAEMLRQINAWEHGPPIGPATWFAQELGFESINWVVLVEAIETRYQFRFPSQEFLLALRLAGQRDFQVGQLANFIHRQQQRPAPGADPS
jgi:acyl carrier protein